MKRLTTILLAAVLCLCLGGIVRALTDTATQSVTVSVAEIAVIDVTGGAISLDIVAPTQGGALPADVTDATAYLQYTSNTDTTSARTITAEINVATPATYDFKLLAGAPTGTNTGSAGTEITLSSTAQSIITAIGDGYTGTGATDGSNLTYKVSCVSMPAMDAGTAYTVTYTLTAAS